MGKTVPLSKQVGSLAKQARYKADKLARLDTCNAVDARRTKKEMVDVPHKQKLCAQGEEWRPNTKWRGAKGKHTRKHTPTVTR